MNDKIERQIEIAAPLAKVWRALTDAKQFGEWFLVKLEGPFVAGQSVGGQLTFPGYEHIRMEVVVKAIEPETYFSYTWHPYAVDPSMDYSQETPTLVEFRLKETAGGKTLLTVTESGFENIPSARRTKAFLSNENGWRQQMENLTAYVDKTA
jgi:uncharacterized protein YndB with AHSA1/START domain